ncbi:FkbM family methyltransferase [Bradyrhizobium sp. WD16]|uniref:FkbM family methyltransferase n=1 Tax=Bradyrhizobium sp. WD16 TaxID=1521768 RepID=UPI0020A54F26|nr:FkbM family methyltransferase [Bradyrhizobium sp. WD16]UTD26532.1 hypothetical protein DB459_05950 [Bradyrhizobium sp. WD16]
MVQVTLAGDTADIIGAAGDEYFQQIQTHAAGLDALAKFVRENLAPDALIADIGANIGLTAIIFARLVPRGRVFAFEPSPETAAFLRQNIELNGLRNVTVVEAALGDAKGTVRFNHAEVFSAGSRVVSEGGIEVPALSLDDFCVQNGVRFDFLKIDTEGYEPWVLTGLTGQLRPELPIWMEFNSLCLTACGANSLAFACGLTRAFDVRRVESDGTFSPVLDGHAFLPENMVRRGCVDDLVLRPRHGCTVPPLAELIGHAPWRAEPPPAEWSARAELAAVYRSTSWRITAPVRAIGQLFK